ncbi:cytochrome c oxidase subunit 6B2 isoform X1 [Sturnira hondurensis]|uniref:cytochrome c oxidase subunit 6B2 isoform X1 n=1 Tax=Sturnira hondurensis TaxID=192404 RepID=UPI00187988DA|nr:cytochrome c oxidase subunit 6B2 isoform X1 [Sturnira hondurensis]
MLDKKPSKGPWPTPPFDPRFPNQNQTRNCYQNFLDYHRCMKKMNRRGKSAQPCEYFFHVFHSLCPISWAPCDSISSLLPGEPNRPHGWPLSRRQEHPSPFSQ